MRLLSAAAISLSLLAPAGGTLPYGSTPPQLLELQVTVTPASGKVLADYQVEIEVKAGGKVYLSEAYTPSAAVTEADINTTALSGGTYNVVGLLMEPQ